jgi:hypothetical protein
MANAQNKKWALDTNVVLDLGRGSDAAVSLRELAIERNYSLHIPPTALKELAQLSIIGDEKLRALEPVLNFLRELSVQCKYIPAVRLGWRRNEKHIRAMWAMKSGVFALRI